MTTRRALRQGQDTRRRPARGPSRRRCSSRQWGAVKGSSTRHCRGACRDVRAAHCSRGRRWSGPG
eukprot:10933593-Lingulodinium_polyedra.AAC.1